MGSTIEWKGNLQIDIDLTKFKENHKPFYMNDHDDLKEYKQIITDKNSSVNINTEWYFPVINFFDGTNLYVDDSYFRGDSFCFRFKLRKNLVLFEILGEVKLMICF